MSKFSLDVLQRCVHPYLKTDDPDVILGPLFGEDVALTHVGGDILASHVDPIVGAIEHIGWLAVHVACNDIATSGAPPRWILLLILVPSKDDENLLEEIMRDARRAADEIGVAIIGGHSGYSSNLSRPLVSVTALGTLSDRKPVLTQGAQAGDHIFLTKGVALEGTAILANDFTEEAVQLGLSDQDLQAASELITGVSIIPEALALAEIGATAMHDVTRGGVLETLLEIATLSGVGIRVDLERINIHAVVSRFAEAFQFDPIKMISSGSLIAAVPYRQVETAHEKLLEIGVPFSDIGQVFIGKGVEISKAGRVEKYQEIHCEDDELARMWALYKE